MRQDEQVQRHGQQRAGIRFSTILLCAFVACLASTGFGAELNSSFQIPKTWRLLHEAQRATNFQAFQAYAPPGGGYQVEVAAVDVLGDWVAFEVRIWRMRPPGNRALQIHPPSRRLHLMNLKKSEHHEIDIGPQDELREPNFLGRNGLVFVGTNVFYEQFGKCHGVSPQLNAGKVRRLANGDFVVHGDGVLHYLDFSRLDVGQSSVQKLENPAFSMTNIVLASDAYAACSTWQSPTDVTLFSRKTGGIIWKDESRGPLLGIGEKHVYMWSYRIARPFAQDVLVRKAVKQPYEMESIDVEKLAPYTHGVIDFCWPHLMLVARQPGSGDLVIVNVDLERGEMTTQFDFTIPGTAVTALGGVQFSDKVTRTQYRLFGDASEKRLILATERVLYEVPRAEPKNYPWAEWKWRPYRFADSKI